MRALAPSFLSVLALVPVLAGCRSDAGECNTACRNGYQLTYRKNANAEISKLPEAEREAARKRKLMDLEEQTNKGINFCVQRCTSAGNDDQVKCMIAAKTAEEAMKCN